MKSGGFLLCICLPSFSTLGIEGWSRGRGTMDNIDTGKKSLNDQPNWTTMHTFVTYACVHPLLSIAQAYKPDTTIVA